MTGFVKSSVAKRFTFGFQNCQHKFEIQKMDGYIWYKYFKLYNK